MVRGAAGKSKERLRSNPKIKPRQPSCQASTAKSTHHLNTTTLLICFKRKPPASAGENMQKTFRKPLDNKVSFRDTHTIYSRISHLLHMLGSPGHCGALLGAWRVCQIVVYRAPRRDRQRRLIKPPLWSGCDRAGAQPLDPAEE